MRCLYGPSLLLGIFLFPRLARQGSIFNDRRHRAVLIPGDNIKLVRFNIVFYDNLHDSSGSQQ